MCRGRKAKITHFMQSPVSVKSESTRLLLDEKESRESDFIFPIGRGMIFVPTTLCKEKAFFKQREGRNDANRHRVDLQCIGMTRC